MTRDDLEAAIWRACTYVGDEGTSGYLLGPAAVDAILAAADRYADTKAGKARGFSDRFTALPDSGVIELHCSTHHPSAKQWTVGYHPSLDVLIEQAHAHNLAEHGDSGEATHG